MPLTQDFIDFYERWSEKANSISLHDNDLAAYYDKFITLYIIYNRLYTEATFELYDRDPDSFEDIVIERNFPDSKGANYCVKRFLGDRVILNDLESNDEARGAVEDMKTILKEGKFYICLRGWKSDGDRSADEQLLRNLESSNSSEKIKAVLRFIYSIRCNLFHGSKGFSPIQIPILKPCIIIVEHLNRLLYDKLSGANNRVLSRPQRRNTN